LVASNRSRLVLAVAMVAVGAVVAAFVVTRGDGVIRPDDPCTERPPLRTWRGVTLQPVALRAFKLAVRYSREPIYVSQSYRSCGQQAKACRTICGNANGCPGRCARPGTSYHQLGAAVDITQESLDSPGVIEAFERAGWCQSASENDPGHFSYGGCH
jgi:hypothetical protein